MVVKTGLEKDINTMDTEERIIQESSEMGAVMENLDSESALNKNTRLSDTEISALLTSEGLQDFKILDRKWFTIPNKFKEMKISKDGLGRQEKVSIFQSERDHRQGGGLFKSIGQMFRRGE